MTRRAKPSTGRSLLVLRNVVLGLVVLTLAVTWWAFRSVRGEVDTALGATAPALLGIANARTALAEAERSATEAFASGRGPMTGPGERYRNQIALANQALTQVATDTVAGDEGRARLRTVEGLVIDYIGLIGQADARQDRATDTVTPLTTANLWYASGLLDDVQTRLAALGRSQRDVLEEQTGPEPVLDVAPLVLSAALAVLLVLTQGRLRRRFRRQVNPALVAATLLTLVVAGIGLLSLDARRDLRVAAGTLESAVADHDAVVAGVGAHGDATLRDFLDRRCAATSCGTSVDRFRATTPDAGPEPDGPGAARSSATATAAIANAGVGGWEPVLPLAAAGVFALVLLGFQPRLAEYRYEGR
ncbi:hypothetical protein [Actinosynnema sp. NPDC020468]|uniref:hypothetical protein n=1 Tax=Actinosynnema sp. NPDC020468 TaxID=3154488 RepID=UPI003409615F